MNLNLIKTSKAINDFFGAWQNQKYDEMVKACQVSWLKNKEPKKRMVEWFGDKNLTNYSVRNVTDETNRMNKFFDDNKIDNHFDKFYTAKIHLNYIVKDNQYSCDVYANIITENNEMKINPTSVLKEKEVKKWAIK